MEELIMKIEEVKYAIQHLDYFVPTEHNCNNILFSVQRLNAVAASLQMMGQKEQEMDVKQE